MAQSTSTFRVFVSSTFCDLKVERNALVKNVFPHPNFSLHKNPFVIPLE